MEKRILASSGEHESGSESATPALSIITICFRNPGELDRTLQQLSALDHSLIQVVIVDGSEDNSCTAVARRYPFALHVKGPDGGKYDAMNKGIALASGDAVLFTNSGDGLASPFKFNEIVRAHRKFLPTHIIYGDAVRIVDGHRISATAPTVEHRNLRLGHLPSHQSTLVPLAYHREHLFDASMDFAADTKFLRKAFSQLPALRLNEPIGIFSFGGVSTSPGSIKLLVQQYREILEVTELTLLEKLWLAARLGARKLIHLAAREAGLQKLQRWRHPTSAVYADAAFGPPQPEFPRSRRCTSSDDSPECPLKADP